MSYSQRNAGMGGGTVWGGNAGGRGPGRMSPGRGFRGRGGGRGGRGNVMVPGRGGRGRMFLPTNRGETGRMNLPQVGSGFGRGRGRGHFPGRLNGRGRGRGPMGMPIGPPSKLDVFNKFIGYKISSCLSREEQEILGMAFPRLRPPPLSPQQKMMMAQKKMFENQKKEFEAHKVVKKIGSEEEKKQENLETNEDSDSTKEDSVKLATSYSEEEKKEEVLEVEKKTQKQDSVDSKKEADLIDETEKSSEIDKADEKAEVDRNKTAVKGADQNKGNTQSESQTTNGNSNIKEDTGGGTGEGEKKIDDDETEDKPDDVCLLTIDGDETIPPPDPECDCENCVTARSTTETCNCESCRTNRVKAIQACDCDRCRALRDRLTRVFSLSEQDCNCKKCLAKKLDPTKKAEMMKAREESLRINLTDCDTLLTQLNTKRLYHRIKYLKGKDKNYDINKAYPYKKTTEEIAEIEWGELLEDYKIRRTDLFPNYKKEGSEKEDIDDENDDSDDEDEEYEYVGDKPSKYELLMFTPCPRAVAVLASYPRSGNSLMRNLYEKITLRVTGSDMMGGLQKHDLVGEMATGAKNVQFVKTHYPERMGAPAFPVSRAVLLVRNPYDAMDSYFNLMSTNTHTTSVTKEDRKKHAKIFADMARKEVLVWRDFHEFWLKQKIPLLVIRYEDLIRWTTKVIGKVVKFVLEVNSMTFFEDRIQRAIGEDQIEKLGPYKVRSGGIGKSLTKGNYSAQLLHQINYGIIDTMEKFGYKEMLIPKPSEWRLEPMDQLGVFIPGTTDETMIINHKGLVRGPKRQTNWQQVKQQMKKDEKEEGQKESFKKVSLL